jgi:threonylcarbamoyladenosine tRNA methylthiotransferase CDKAL1
MTEMQRKPRAKSFYVYAKIHCPRRSLDSTRLFRYLAANGLKPVASPEEADLIFVYTCGGFNLDEYFSLLTVQKSLRVKSAQVIVTGCLTKIDPGKLDAFPHAIVITPDELERLDSFINATVSYADCPNESVVEGVHDLYHGSLLSRVRRNVGFNGKLARICGSYINRKLLHKPTDLITDPNIYRLEIAKGCLGSCSYCAIKKAMPSFHSFPENEILKNFNKGLSAGYKYFAVLAGDIGCYGLDIGTNLPHLLQELFKVEADYKLLLVDLNARWFVKYYQELLSILKPNADRISRIIMPIQSGSDRMLELMNRQYEIDEVKRCVLDLQRNIPGIMLETHILVGFPGETEDDFQQSVQLVKDLPFLVVAVYKYEDRPGTVAFDMPDKVPKIIKDQRVRYFKKNLKMVSLTNG